MFKKLGVILRQIYESLYMALQSVVINKTRTFLSLFGITIGIFAIISVYTAIDTLEGYMRHSLGSMSQTMVHVGKWPWGPEEGETEYKWWKFMNRPEVKEAEFEELMELLPEIKEATFQVSVRRAIKYGNGSYNNAIIIGSTPNVEAIRQCKIAEGRYITPYEFDNGSPIIVIGATIAEELFQGESPIGKTVKLAGRKVEIVGLFEKEGSNQFGASWDEQVLIPINYIKNIVSIRRSSPGMHLIPDESISLVDFKELVRAKMRNLRRLPLAAEDNFALNDIVSISKQLDGIFAMINVAGSIIGIFSILVGGFGVANIMFVSVRERTSQIGIQKALGAKQYFIMLQFTFEAVILSILGGIIGLFLIWIVTIPASSMLNFDITLSIKNILIGLGISFFVGAVSGIFPAYSAAKMDPVKAITKTT